jgi:L-ascorbate metabolism protein UlaG (beta-lactamase superfamily)
VTASVTYYGNAVCSITLGSATVLVDPYISENDEHELTVAEVVEAEDPDAVLVTHSAHDHIGEAETIAMEYDVPVLTEPAAGHYLEATGVPDELVTTVVWGMTASIEGLSIRILEAHHVSIMEHEGDLLSGQPLSFLISDGDNSVYHMGDTSIFSDLQLVGERHDPDVICLGVGQAYDAAAEADERITTNIAELSTDEAVMAAEWIEPDHVLPIHFVGDERAAFVDALSASSAEAEAAPLDVGETLEL